MVIIFVVIGVIGGSREDDAERAERIEAERAERYDPIPRVPAARAPSRVPTPRAPSRAERAERYAEFRAKAAAGEPVTEELVSTIQIFAERTCKEAIEDRAKYSYEWTDGFLESAFTRYSTKRTPEGYVIIFGDKLYFTNGYGAKVRMEYSCTVYPGDDDYSVIRVDVAERGWRQP